MKVIFKKLQIQNLLSFGNKETVIDFNNGLNLITGQNGAGKSSALLDAISFAIYDKPYRKINKSELINRKNKKNLKVICEFDVNDISYKIIRGLKSDIDLEFYIDGEKQNLLSSKGLSQNEIESHIGIDYKLFKQIISLSINHNTPFLTLPSQEKRELLEKFFNIDIISHMLKNAKDTYKNIKIKKDIISNSVDMLSSVIITDKRRISELSDSKKTFDSDKLTELLEIDEKINLNTINLKQLKTEAKLKKVELDGLLIDRNLSELNTSKDAINKQIVLSENNINSANKILKALNSYDICPTCKSPLTEDHKNMEISVQNDIIRHNTFELEKLQKDLLNIKKDIVTIDEKLKKEQDLKYSLKYLKNQYINIDEQITKLNLLKEKVTNKEFIINIDLIIDEYNQKELEYQQNKSELLTLNESLLNYNTVIGILSDTGVKSYIFEQLIPILNKNINHYLNIFDLPVYIEFDNTMNDSIKSASNFNNVVSYLSFSEGEKKKIDMAILLSFIDVTKKVANWNCNLLIIDELLDSSIDDNGLEKMLESLEKIVESDPTMGIYIISHRFKLEYKHFFNNMIEVVKSSDGFSKINSI